MAQDSPLPHVTGIIPTLGLRERRDTLRRAIASLIAQEGAAVTPLVVINGQRFDADLINELRERGDVRVHQIAEASVVAAQRAGRALVDSEFFCFLDDDDEYLPGAVAARLAAMREEPQADVIVSNGYRFVGQSRDDFLEDMSAVAANPLLSLVRSNWLASCGGLFRSARVGPDLFTAAHPHHEWTYLAFKLVLSRRIRFIPDKTFVIHDSPVSASKSADHLLATVHVIREILKLDLDATTRRLVRSKYAAALHSCADHRLDSAGLAEAWKFHVASLIQPGGLGRYGFYTRRLVSSSIKACLMRRERKYP